MSLKDKRVLITAGPTWVPIDSVRVISNKATGETGLLLAGALAKSAARVTLLLGPLTAPSLNGLRDTRIIRFASFEELKRNFIRELKSRNYDMVVHSAAVSDYRPREKYGMKIKSGRKSWKITLVPTVKIIDLIKKIAPSVFAVGFKFEPKEKKSKLIKDARALLRRAGLNLAVANTVKKSRYEAYIVGDKKIYGHYGDKKSLVNSLVNILGEVL